MKASVPKLAVAQLGARMHYAVPRIFAGQDRLERLFTDFYLGGGFLSCLNGVPERLRPNFLKRALGRSPHGISADRITAFNRFGCEYAQRRRRSASARDSLAAHLWAGRAFCERVLQVGLGDAQGVYTFNSAGLELLRYAGTRGLRAVMEQTIAPMQIERELMRAECERFPDWHRSASENDLADEFIAREKAEWQASDLILCGSNFVRDGVARCGGPVERCIVVPYGVDARFDVRARAKHGGPLRVLTVGDVGLRKGSPYVLAAAKSLGSRARFRMVGTVSAGAKALEQLRPHVEITGPVPRSEILRHYAWADAFLLPSLCEGSATVTYEALACGLPVLTTPNTGSIVRDGVDGFIVPVRDPESIIARLETFLAGPNRIESFSANAYQRAREATLETYARRLIEALGVATNSRGAI